MNAKVAGENKLTTWDDIVAFDESIKKRGGYLTSDDLVHLDQLFRTLDESTLPEGVKFPLGYQGEEKEQS